MVCSKCETSTKLVDDLRTQLADKDQNVQSLHDKLNRSKLQSKAKIASLRQQLGLLVDADVNGDSGESAEPLLSQLARLTLRLDEANSDIGRCNDKIGRQEEELADDRIRIKSLEAEVVSVVGTTETAKGEPLSRDMQAMHSQMTHKDTLIIELNNDLISRDGRIIELLESCRDQTRLIETKGEAVAILKQQLFNYTDVTRSTVATETIESMDDLGYYQMNDEPSSSSAPSDTGLGPGQAQLVFPSYDQDDSNNQLPELSSDFSQPMHASSPLPPAHLAGKRRLPFVGVLGGKKHVTFDLPPATPSSDVEFDLTAVATLNDRIDQLNGAVVDYERQIEVAEKENHDFENAIRAMQEEKAEQRVTVDALERDRDELLSDREQMHDDRVLQEKLFDARIQQIQLELEDSRREAKNTTLKAKAALQARVKDLEMMLAEGETKCLELREAYEEGQHELYLTKSRQGDVSETMVRAHMRDQEDLTEYEQAMEGLKESNEELQAQVIEAQRTADSLLSQKRNVLDDVDQLKEALDTSQLLIEELEGDLQLNRSQGEVLREQLDERLTTEQSMAGDAQKTMSLKSKAYDTKLRLLEQTNEALKGDVNTARLRAKAFEAKMRVVEREKEEQVEKLKNADGEMISLRLRSAAVEEELANVRAETSSLTVELTEAKSLNGKLNAKLETATLLEAEIADEKNEVENEMTRLWERDANLKRQLAELESTNRQLAEERLKFRAQCKELIHAENELTLKFDQITLAHKRQTADLKIAQDRSVALEASASADTKHLADQLQQVKTEWESMQSASVEWKRRVSQLNNEIEGLKVDRKNGMEKVEGLETSLNVKDVLLTEMQARLTETESELGRNKENVMHLQSAVETAQTSAAEIQRPMIEELQSRLLSAQSVIDTDRSSTETAVNQLNETINQLAAENSSLQSSMICTQEQLATAVRERQEKEEGKERDDEEVDRLRREGEEMARANEGVREELAVQSNEVDKLRGENDLLLVDNEAARVEKEGNLQRMEELMTQLNELGQALQQSNAKVDELNVGRQSQIEQTTETTNATTVQLSQLKLQLEEQQSVCHSQLGIISEHEVVIQSMASNADELTSKLSKHNDVLAKVAHLEEEAVQLATNHKEVVEQFVNAQRQLQEVKDSSTSSEEKSCNTEIDATVTQAELKASLAELDALKLLVGQHEAYSTQVQQQFAQMQEALATANQQITELQQSATSRADEMKDTDCMALCESTALLGDAQTEVTQLKEMLRVLSSADGEKEDEIVKANEEVAKMGERLEEAKIEYATLQKETTNQQEMSASQTSDAKIEFERLADELTVKSANLVDSSQAVEQLRLQLGQMEEQHRSVMENHSLASERIAELETQLSAANATTKAAEIEAQQKKPETTETVDSSKMMKTRVKKLVEKLKKKEEECKVHQSTVETLQLSLATAVGAVESQRRETMELQQSAAAAEESMDVNQQLIDANNALAIKVEELNSLSEKMEWVQSDLDEISTENRSLREQVEGASKTVENVKHQDDDEKEQLACTVAELTERCDVLNRELQEMATGRDWVQAELEEKNEEMENLQKEKTAVCESLAAAKENIAEKENEHSSLKAQLEALESRMVQQSNTDSEADTKLGESEATRASLERELKEEREKNRREHETMVREKGELAEKCANVAHELCSAEEALSVVREEAIEKDARVLDLEAQTEKMLSEIEQRSTVVAEESQNAVAAKDEELAAMKVGLEQAQSSLDAKCEKLLECESQLSLLQTTNRETAEHIHILTLDVDSIKEQLENTMSENEAQRASISQMEEKEKSLLLSSEEKDVSLAAQQEWISNAQTMMNGAVGELQQKLADAQQTIETVQEEKTRLEGALVEKEKHVENVEKENSVALELAQTASDASFAGMAEERMELDGQLAQMKTNLDAKISEIEELKLTIEEQRKENESQVEKVLVNLQTQSQRNEDSLSAAELRYNEMFTKMTQLVTDNEVMVEEKSAVIDLKAQISALETALANQQSTNGELVEQAQMYELRIEELRKAVGEVAQLNEDVENLKGELRDAAEEIEEKQYEIDELSTRIEEYEIDMENYNNEEVEEENEYRIQSEPRTISCELPIVPEEGSNEEMSGEEEGRTEKSPPPREEGRKDNSPPPPSIVITTASMEEPIVTTKKSVNVGEHETTTTTVVSKETVETRETHFDVNDEQESLIGELKKAMALGDARINQLTADLQLAAQSDDLHATIDDQRKEIGSLHDRLGEATGERDRLAGDRHTLCEEVVQLNHAVAEGKGANEAQQIVISGLNDSVDSLSADNDRLNEECNRLGDSVKDNEEMVPQLRRKVAVLEEDGQLLRHCLSTTNTTVAELETTIATLTTAVEEEHSASQSRVDCAAAEKDEEHATLLEVQASLASTLDDLDKSRADYDEVHTKLAEITGYYTVLYEERQARVDGEEGETRELLRRVDELEVDKINLGRVMTERMEQITRLTNEQTESEAQMSANVSTKEELDKEISSMKENISDLMEEKQDAKDQVENLLIQLFDVQDIRRDLQEDVNELKEMVKAEREKMGVKEEEDKTAMAALQAEIGEKTKALELCLQQLAEVEQHIMQCEEGKSTVDSVDHSDVERRLEEQLDDNVVTIEGLVATVTQLEEGRDELAAQSREESGKVDRLSAELTGKNTECDHLSKQMHTLTTAVEQLRTNLANEHASSGEAEQRLVDYQNEITVVHNEKVLLREQLANCQTQLEKLSESLNADLAEMVGARESLEMQLREKDMLLAEYRQKHTVVQAEVESLQQASNEGNSQAQSQLKDLQLTNEQLTDDLRCATIHAERMEANVGDFKELMADRGRIATLLEEKEGEVVKVERERRLAIEEGEEMKERLGEMEARCVTMAKELAGGQERGEEVDRLKDELDEARTAHDRKVTQLDELTKTLDTVKSSHEVALEHVVDANNLERIAAKQKTDAELHDLRRTVDDLEQNLSSQRTRADTAESLESEVSTLRWDMDVVMTEMEGVKRERDGLLGANGELRDQLGEVERNGDLLNEEFTKVRHQLKSTTDSAQQKSGEVAQLQQEVMQLRQQLAECQQAVVVAEVLQQQQQSTPAMTQNVDDRRVGELEVEVDQLKSDREAVNQQRDDAMRQLGECSEKISQLERRNADFAQDAAESSTLHDRLREQTAELETSKRERVGLGNVKRDLTEACAELRAQYDSSVEQVAQLRSTQEDLDNELATVTMRETIRVADLQASLTDLKQEVEKLRHDHSTLQSTLVGRDAELAAIKQWQAIQMDDDGLHNPPSGREDDEMPLLSASPSTSSTFLPFTSADATRPSTTSAITTLIIGQQQRLSRMLRRRAVPVTIFLRILFILYVIILHAIALRCVIWW